MLSETIIIKKKICFHFCTVFFNQSLEPVKNIQYIIFNLKVASPTPNIIINPKQTIPKIDLTTSIIQSDTRATVKSESSGSSDQDLSIFNDAQIRALKKQQRMIKNR